MSKEHPVNSKKVLLADDTATMRQLMRALILQFKDLTFIFFEADTGSRAIKVAHASKPDIIFMDLNMPEGSGLEALRDFKAHEDTKNIPVAIVTTFDQDDKIEACRQLGCETFIRKPVKIGEVHAALRALVAV